MTPISLDGMRGTQQKGHLLGQQNQLSLELKLNAARGQTVKACVTQSITIHVCLTWQMVIPIYVNIQQKLNSFHCPANLQTNK